MLKRYSFDSPVESASGDPDIFDDAVDVDTNTPSGE